MGQVSLLCFTYQHLSTHVVCVSLYFCGGPTRAVGTARARPIPVSVHFLSSAQQSPWNAVISAAGRCPGWDLAAERVLLSGEEGAAATWWLPPKVGAAPDSLSPRQRMNALAQNAAGAWVEESWFN